MARAARSIDEYLAGVHAEKRAALEALRRTIRRIAPDAEECISYGMPAFRVGGTVVAGFAATGTGGSYYPFSGETLATLRADLVGRSRTKSALHFVRDEPLPAGLVRKLIRARVAEIPRRPTPVPKRRSAVPKMKAYASFDLYLADQPPRNRSLIRALRAFVKRTEPELVEFVKWGNGCWLKGKAPVAYVYSDVDHVQFGFLRGSSLKDPRGLLQGKGQYVRHVKVRKPADIDPKAFAALLRQAAR